MPFQVKMEFADDGRRERPDLPGCVSQGCVSQAGVSQGKDERETLTNIGEAIGEAIPVWAVGQG